MNPTHGLAAARESKQDRIEEHTCCQALGPLDSFVVFQVLVFRVNVAEEANSNTRSGKSSHSSDDFPEFEAAAHSRPPPPSATRVAAASPGTRRL